MGDHLHDGHRQRMRERFLKSGGSGFRQHELLEMLLYYAIPRINTNDIAHRLLERFGSISGIIAADHKALCSVKGITENTAVLLKLLPALYAADMDEHTTSVTLDSYEKACEYFRKLYQYESKEVIRLACLDDMLRVQSCQILQTGSTTSVSLSLRAVAELAILEHCNTVMIAHNHPDGLAVASAEDIAATRHLYQGLQSLSIRLIDHVVVGRNGAISMRESGAFLCMERGGKP
ncbi:MAG: hypothetical protein IKM30_03255 [Oscillospiraceae bacterium]|nr:hypothetical protein [Oscillospiraceae bacterium]